MPLNLFVTGAGQSVTLSDPGFNVVGGTGSQTVKLTATAVGTILDPNIERVEFSGALSAYTFNAVAGVGVQVFSGTTLVTTIGSLNQNATLAFANGSVALAQTGGAAFTVGGTALTATAAVVTPVTINAVDVTTVAGPVAPLVLTATTSAVTLVEPAQVTAGTNTTANMTFTVTLSAAQTTATVVNFATSSGTGDLAVAASDYTATNGSLTFAAGETSKTFTVAVIGDGVFDGIVSNPTGTETFTVTLSSPTTAFATTSVKGTITDLQTNALPTQTVPAVAANILLSSGFTNVGAGLAVADANNANVTTVVTAGNGLLTNTANGSIAASSAAARTLTFTGTLAEVTAALRSISYSSDRTIAGVDTITIVTTDPLGGVSTSGTLTVNVNPGGTFTAGGATVNTFVGTAGNDFYLAAAAADINTGSTLAAGTGTDTLTIGGVITAALSQTTAFTGVEVVNLTSTATAARAVTLDMAKLDSSTTTVNFTDGDGNATVASGNADSFALTAVPAAATITVNSRLTTLDISENAAGQTVTVALGGGVTVGTLQTTTNAATTFNIQSNGTAANVITATSAGATPFLATTNVAISGAAAFTMTTGAVAGPLTINGSTATGALTINNAASTATTTTITGGIANDTITGSSTIANTLAGGAGNDIINGGAAADTINGGAGDDTINGGVGAADVSITGGLGKDTITVNQSGDTVIVAAGDTGTVAANTADVIVGLRDGVKIDLSSYYTGASFIANGNLVTATAGANATLREIYINAANKSIVIEMDAAGTTTQEIFIGAGAGATIANVNGVLTFGPVPLVASVVSGVVVVEGQNATGGSVAVTLATAIPQIGGVNVNGATTSTANLNASGVSGANGLTITGSTVANTIVGSSAADVITGGAGVDTITTGAGADTVRIANVGANGVDRDIVTDLVVGVGGDILNFNTGVALLTGTNDFAGAASLQNHAAAGNLAVSGATEVVTVAAATIADATSANSLNGTNLLTAIGGTLTGSIVGQNNILVAVGIAGGGTALYYASSADNAIIATEITLVGVLNGVAVGGLVVGNFTNVA